MFRAGHCICRHYHNPDDHGHDESEERIENDTWFSTCSGGELVKKCKKASRVDRYRLRFFVQAGIETTYLCI